MTKTELQIALTNAHDALAVSIALANGEILRARRAQRAHPSARCFDADLKDAVRAHGQIKHTIGLWLTPAEARAVRVRAAHFISGDLTFSRQLFPRAFPAAALALAA